MTRNERNIKLIGDGIKQGFKEIGFDLTDRERLIISMTIKGTIVFIDQLIGRSKINDEG